MDEWHKELRPTSCNDPSIVYAVVQMKRFLFNQLGMNCFSYAIHESFLLKAKSLIQGSVKQSSQGCVAYGIEWILCSVNQSIQDNLSSYSRSLRIMWFSMLWPNIICVATNWTCTIAVHILSFYVSVIKCTVVAHRNEMVAIVHLWSL
jgi:hypothetical protein